MLPWADLDYGMHACSFFCLDEMQPPLVRIPSRSSVKSILPELLNHPIQAVPEEENSLIVVAD